MLNFPIMLFNTVCFPFYIDRVCGVVHCCENSHSSLVQPLYVNYISVAHVPHIYTVTFLKLLDVLQWIWISFLICLYSASKVSLMFKERCGE